MAMKRVVIVNDESGRWYIRKLRLSVHDGVQDEMVYHCDEPIGTNFRTPYEAFATARQYLEK